MPGQVAERRRFRLARLASTKGPGVMPGQLRSWPPSRRDTMRPQRRDRALCPVRPAYSVASAVHPCLNEGTGRYARSAHTSIQRRICFLTPQRRDRALCPVSLALRHCVAEVTCLNEGTGRYARSAPVAAVPGNVAVSLNEGTGRYARSGENVPVAADFEVASTKGPGVMPGQCSQILPSYTCGFLKDGESLFQLI